MFDPCGSDSENLPREGAAVAAEWKFGDDAKRLLANDPSVAEKAQAEEIERRWSREDGSQLQEVPTVYFRVVVHEIGHSMCRIYNLQDAAFMNTTDSIADEELSSQN